jgi:hypothetical protein
MFFKQFYLEGLGRETDPAGDRLPDEVGLAAMLEHLRIFTLAER